MQDPTLLVEDEDSERLPAVVSDFHTNQQYEVSVEPSDGFSPFVCNGGETIYLRPVDPPTGPTVVVAWQACAPPEFDMEDPAHAIMPVFREFCEALQARGYELRTGRICFHRELKATS